MAGSQHSYFENPSKNLYLSPSPKVIKFLNYKLRRALEKSVKTVVDKLGLQLSHSFTRCVKSVSQRNLCVIHQLGTKGEEQIKICVCQVEPEKTLIWSPIQVDVPAALHCLMHKMKHRHRKKLATWTCTKVKSKCLTKSQILIYIFFLIKYLLFNELQLCYTDSMLNVDEQNSFCHFLLLL